MPRTFETAVAATLILTSFGAAAAGSKANTGTYRAYTTPTALMLFDPANPAAAPVRAATGKFAVDDAAAQAPVQLGPRIIEQPVYDPATGAILGYIAKSGTKIDRLDARAAQSAHLFDIQSAVSFDTDALPGKGLIYMSTQRTTDAGIDKLLQYDVASGQVAERYAYVSGYHGTFLLDANNAYVTDGRKIKKITHAGAATQITQTAAGTAPSLLAESAHRLIVQLDTTAANTNSLVSYPIAGGTPATLITEGSHYYFGVFAAGTRVHANVFDLLGGAPQDALLVEEDDSATESHIGGFWTPAQFDPQRTADQTLTGFGGLGAVSIGLYVQPTPSSVVISLSSATGPFGARQIGTLTGLKPDTGGFVIGVGRYLVGTATYKHGTRSDSDVIRFDTQTAGSLGTVQSAAGTNEVVRSF